jgi:hypothetical protein
LDVRYSVNMKQGFVLFCNPRSASFRN